MTAQPRPDPVTSGQPPARDKTGIPKNPGRRDLGMKVSLLFPDRDIVEKFYVPVIYTACRTCYSEEVPEEIFEKAVSGGYDPAKMQKLISSVIESGPRLDHRARRLHLRDHRGLAHAVAPARPASRRRRVRPAEPALREVQGRGHDAAALDRRGRPGAPREVRGADRRRARPVRRDARGGCARARTRGSSSRTRPGPTS